MPFPITVITSPSVHIENLSSFTTLTTALSHIINTSISTIHASLSSNVDVGSFRGAVSEVVGGAHFEHENYIVSQRCASIVPVFLSLEVILVVTLLNIDQSGGLLIDSYFWAELTIKGSVDIANILERHILSLINVLAYTIAVSAAVNVVHHSLKISLECDDCIVDACAVEGGDRWTYFLVLVYVETVLDQC